MFRKNTMDAPGNIRLFISLLIAFASVKTAQAQLVPGIRANGALKKQGDLITTCIGTSVTYISTAQNASTITWRFKNGSPSTGNSGLQVINYNVAGTDTTWQIVTAGGDKDSMYVLVRVTDVKPTANYTFTPNNECANIPVDFTNASAGNGLSYSWNFGDGGVSTQANPSYQFLNAIGLTGTQPYSVKLVVTNNQFCKDSITKTVNVLKIPDASIGRADPLIESVIFNGVPTLKRCQNLPNYDFKFVNTSTTISINMKYTIKWGDNSPDSVFSSWAPGEVISHNYSIGQSKLEIQVVGSNGCIGIKRYNVFLGTTPAGGFQSLGNETICAPNALNFVITGYANNAPGTIYRVQVNDNTPPDLFNQPPPDTVSHVFNISSCGNVSTNGAETYNNSFTASINIENPCGAKSVTVIPIYISGKPKAIISLSPSETVCTNSSLYVGDNSIYGGSIATSGSNSTCSNTGNRVWKITPSTGYTISPGFNFGSLNNSPNDGFFWTSGSQYFFANFTTPGTYSVKLYVYNSSCGIDSITKTICVRTPPVASFTMDKKSGCGPDTATLTNTSPVGGCLGESYNWAVNYVDPSNCGGTPLFTFINGTTATSKSPQIRFVNPGRYIVTLTTTAIGASFSCPAATAKDTFNIKAKPKAVINSLSAVCLGNTISPTATVNNCYANTPVSYLWTFNNGSPGTSGQANPGAITYSTIGSFKIKLEVGNECGVTADSTTAIITSTPTANAGTDKVICSGETVQLGAAPSAGLTYSWTPVAGLSSTSVSNPTATLDYNGPSNDTTFTFVLATSAGANCSGTDTIKVTVRKKPQVTVTPAASQVCAGSAVELTASGANTYTWAPATGLNTTNGDVVIATPVANTPYVVTGTSTNGCTASATATVSVIPYLPVNAGPDTTVCNSSTAIQLTGLPAGGLWSGSSTVNAAGVFNANAAGIGVHKLYYTAGTGICTKADSILVSVIDLPVSSAGSDTTICQSTNTFQLQGSPAGGRWSGSPAVSISGLFTPSVPGNYTLTYTIGGGTCTASDTRLLNVIGGLTNNIISGDQNVCPGATPNTITGQSVTGGNGQPVYQWQSSTDNINWNNIIGASARDYQPAVIVQTTWFRRIATTTLCSGPEASISAAVNLVLTPDATAEFNPATPGGCVPFVITPAIINLTPFNNSVSEYRWFVNNTFIGGGQNFPGYTMNNPGDSITVTLVAISSFGCKNDTIRHGFVTAESPVPALSQSITEGCGPLSVMFSNNTPNAARYSYLWDFGQGQTSTATQPGPVNFPINPSFGDTVYTVVMKTFSVCDTLTLTRQVKVRAQPKALFTPDRTEGCSPMKVSFTNTSRGSNANYIWDFGDGSPLLNNNNTTVQHTFTTGVRDTFFVKLKGINDCNADSLVYAIVVNPNSIRLDYAINGNEKFGCAPHTVRFINNTTGANSFLWHFGDGDSLITTLGIDTVIHTYTAAGIYNTSLYATNSCNDTTDFETIRVEVKPNIAFTASPLVTCVNDTIHFSNTSDAGISNRWNFGDGSTSSQVNPVKVFTRAGTYRVSLTGSNVFDQGLSCADSVFADIIIRDTIPGTILVSSNNGSCIPFEVTFKNGEAPTVQTTWDFGDGNFATGDSVTHTYATNGSYTVIMTGKGNTGCTSLDTKLITVNAPVGIFTYSGAFLCGGDAARFEVQGGNASAYTYVFGDGDTLTSTNTIAFHQYDRPGRYVPQVFLVNNGCQLQLSTGDTIKADKIIAGFSYTTQYNCGVTTVQFIDTTAAFFGIRSRLWNFGDGTVSSNTNPTKTFTQNGTYYINLLVTGNSGCTDTITVPVSVAVRNYPEAVIAGDSLACTGQPANFSSLVQSQDSIANYSWTFGNNVAASGLNVTALYNTSGIYTVRLVTGTIYGCADTATKIIRVNASPVINAGPDKRICLGQSAQLTAFGGNTYLWSPLQNLSCTTCSNPVASPLLSTVYTVRGSNPLGCSITDTILVEVVQPFKLTVSDSDTICIGEQTQLFAAGTTNYLWNPAAGLSSATAPNPIANPQVTTSYRVIGADPFNCFADTGYVTVVVGAYTTVNLGTGRLVVAGTAIQLNPALTNGPFKNYVWTPATDLSCANCATPVATINNNITYKLEAENIYGCKASDTVTYTVRCEDALQVFIPNAFSPDGDQVNDVLMVRGKGLSMVKYLRIFNRWGELVFERNNFSANDPRQGWDGKIRGVPANPDVYVYTAEVICTAGGNFIRKGNVTLFR